MTEIAVSSASPTLPTRTASTSGAGRPSSRSEATPFTSWYPTTSRSPEALNPDAASAFPATAVTHNPGRRHADAQRPAAYRWRGAAGRRPRALRAAARLVRVALRSPALLRHGVGLRRARDRSHDPLRAAGDAAGASPRCGRHRRLGRPGRGRRPHGRRARFRAARPVRRGPGAFRPASPRGRGRARRPGLVERPDHPLATGVAPLYRHESWSRHSPACRRTPPWSCSP